MATEADLQAWTAASGRNWDQLCQALIWNYCANFGSAPVTYPSALAAYYATPIVSYDAFSAPPGSVVYFDIGTYGHVGFEVDSGDAMGSGRVTVVWGINAGTASIEEYVSRTGATPLGWGWTNGVNTLPYTAAGGGGGSPAIEEDEPMSWNFIGGANDAEGVYIIGPKGFRHLNPQEYDLLKRFRILRVDTSGNLQGDAAMMKQEMQIVADVLADVL